MLAAVEHLTAVRREEVLARTAELPTGGGRTRAVLGVLADLFTGPLFVAAAELWMAARTDDDAADRVNRVAVAEVGASSNHSEMWSFDGSTNRIP